MSILIKGIDLPKDKLLRLEIEPDGTVWEDDTKKADWKCHPKGAINITDEILEAEK